MNIFTLPVMFLACFQYDVTHNIDEIRGWRFEQPISIRANWSATITVGDDEFLMKLDMVYCTALVAEHQSSIYLDGKILFDIPSSSVYEVGK